MSSGAGNSTKDVDAIFEPSSDVRAAAFEVSEKLGMPADWLNDAAKAFLSPSGEFTPIETVNLSNLRVQAPTPEYVLAMKVLAARAGMGNERGDANDIEFLIRLLGLSEVGAAMDIVGRYYDPSRMLPRSVYLVEEILEALRR